MSRKHSFLKIAPKLFYETNRFFSYLFYQDFEFHPKTKPLETNPALGVGNGHALSRDLHILIPLLMLLRFLGCKSILDLGSGDGYVLRPAEKLRFAKTVGVEADIELFKLSQKNCPKSELFNMYFEEIKLDDFPNAFDVIYLFNPAQYETTMKACGELRSKWWLMKNFSLLDQDKLTLGVEEFASYKNFELYKRRIMK
jgi:SAM-dependent methyltransferase